MGVCFADFVNVADSLSSMNLYADAVTQIAHLYSYLADNSVLKIKYKSVQQQNGYTDCGLFAIAYVVEVCLGRKPEEARFDQDKMRPHLSKCLSSGRMEAFPSMVFPAEEHIPRPKGGILHVELFCLCKLQMQDSSLRYQAACFGCSTLRGSS